MVGNTCLSAIFFLEEPHKIAKKLVVLLNLEYLVKSLAADYSSSICSFTYYFMLTNCRHKIIFNQTHNSAKVKLCYSGKRIF